MADVPAHYLHNLLQQSWIRQYKPLFAYLEKNKSTIVQQALEAESAKGATNDEDNVIDTYDDYLRHYRGF